VDALEGRLAPLVEKGLEDVQVEGIALTDIRVERFLDMRYVGQSYELIVPFSGAVIEDFHRLHAARYGYSIPGEAVEVVNLRVRAVGRVEPPVLASQPLAGVDPTPALLDTRGVVFHDGIRQVPFYRGESLQPGNRLSGPAVVLRSDTTILVGPSDRAEVDPFGNLSISVGAQ
jgi:N-methylhydantoinase A